MTNILPRTLPPPQRSQHLLPHTRNTHELIINSRGKWQISSITIITTIASITIITMLSIITSITIIISITINIITIIIELLSLLSL